MPEVNLGLLLFIPYRYLESAVLAELRRQGHDLPINEARVFQRIGPRGSRMSDLAAAAQVSKQTLTSIVDRLERRGYVRRDRDPDDARATIVSITARGRELVELSQVVVARVECEWETQLGRARFAQLRALLQDLAATTDPFREPGEGSTTVRSAD